MTLPTLQELWDSHTGRLVDKWAHYLPIYERYFAKWREKPVRLLEIGVSHGGSLQLWKAYFGPYAEITGLDIDPRCAEYAEQQIYICTVDQGNAEQMHKFAKSMGPWDIVIDDGSHKTFHQKISFNVLWNHISPEGVYLIEDCHEQYPFGDEQTAGLHYYDWVVVIEKLHVEPKRIVTGHPSRRLNGDELAAYGAIDAKYRE